MGFESTVSATEFALVTRLGAPWQSLPRQLYLGDDRRVHHNQVCTRGTSRKPMHPVHDKRSKIRDAYLGPCPDCVRPNFRIVPDGVDALLNLVVEDAKQVHLLNKALAARDTLGARVAAAKALFAVQQATGAPRRPVNEGDPGFEMATWALGQHARFLTSIEEQRERLRRWVDGPLVKARNQLFAFKDIDSALGCLGQDALAAAVAAMAWPQVAADARARWVVAVGPARRDEPAWLETARGAGYALALGPARPDDSPLVWSTMATLWAEGLDLDDALVSARVIAA